MQVNFGENDIKDLLTKVKIFNASIGDYQLFTVNEHFSYFVKLSNGSIILTIDNLIANKEQTLTQDHLQALASKFNSTTAPTVDTITSKISAQPEASKVKEETYSTTPPKKKRSALRILSLTIGTLLLLGLVTLFVLQSFFPEVIDKIENANGSHQDYSTEASSYEEQQTPKTEEELKAELLQKEKSNPGKYIDGRINNRENLLAQRVFEGTLTNKATLCGYKNIRLRITALAKTGYELEKRDYVITEFIKAQSSTSFILKTEAWDSKTTEFKYTFIEAETY